MRKKASFSALRPPNPKPNLRPRTTSITSHHHKKEDERRNDDDDDDDDAGIVVVSDEHHHESALGGRGFDCRSGAGRENCVFGNDFLILN